MNFNLNPYPLGQLAGKALSGRSANELLRQIQAAMSAPLPPRPVMAPAMENKESQIAAGVAALAALLGARNADQALGAYAGMKQGLAERDYQNALLGWQDQMAGSENKLKSLMLGYEAAQREAGVADEKYQRAIDNRRSDHRFQQSLMMKAEDDIRAAKSAFNNAVRSAREEFSRRVTELGGWGVLTDEQRKAAIEQWDDIASYLAEQYDMPKPPSPVTIEGKTVGQKRLDETVAQNDTTNKFREKQWEKKSAEIDQRISASKERIAMAQGKPSGDGGSGGSNRGRSVSSSRTYSAAVSKQRSQFLLWLKGEEAEIRTYKAQLAKMGPYDPQRKSVESALRASYAATAKYRAYLAELDVKSGGQPKPLQGKIGGGVAPANPMDPKYGLQPQSGSKPPAAKRPADKYKDKGFLR